MAKAKETETAADTGIANLNLSERCCSSLGLSASLLIQVAAAAPTCANKTERKATAGPTDGKRKSKPGTFVLPWSNESRYHIKATNTGSHHSRLSFSDEECNRKKPVKPTAAQKANSRRRKPTHKKAQKTTKKNQKGDSQRFFFSPLASMKKPEGKNQQARHLLVLHLLAADRPTKGKPQKNEKTAATAAPKGRRGENGKQSPKGRGAQTSGCPNTLRVQKKRKKKRSETATRCSLYQAQQDSLLLSLLVGMLAGLCRYKRYM